MKNGVMVLLGGVAVLGLSVLTGCESLTQSAGENWNTVAHTTDTNLKQIPDDVGEVLLLDRPSRLSRKPIPNN